MPWRRIWHTVIITGVSPVRQEGDSRSLLPDLHFPSADRALVCSITVTACPYPSHGCLIVMVIEGRYPEFSHEKISSEEEPRTLQRLLPGGHRQKPPIPRTFTPRRQLLNIGIRAMVVR